MTLERLVLVQRYCYPQRTWDRKLRYNLATQCWELPYSWMLSP